MSIPIQTSVDDQQITFQFVDKQKVNSSLTGHCKRILEYLVELGEAGATNDEIAAQLDIPLQSVTPACLRLRDSKYVTFAGVYRLSRRDRDARVWIASGRPSK